MNSSAQKIVEKCLISCGYEANCIHSIPSEVGAVTFTAYAHIPFDTRSACVTVLDAGGDIEDRIAESWQLGSPVVFVLEGGDLQWWQFQNGKPVFRRRIASNGVRDFFRQNRDVLSPHRVYRAKTQGMVDRSQQLDFVDIGLLPLLEQETGNRVGKLVAELLGSSARKLNIRADNRAGNRELFQAVFRLLACKILKDKEVNGFRTLDLRRVDVALKKISKHYGAKTLLQPQHAQWNDQLTAVAERLDHFTSLQNLSTEALGHIYESTLITPAIRKELGTHSTPTYLIDYIVWQLAPLVKQIPLASVRVFEPCCGHAGFLVAMVRLLKELSASTPVAERSKLLRKSVCGLEIDAFALEIARLSLTLADVPNPNGWRLEEEDVFASSRLTELARQSNILLMNPPYAGRSTEDVQRHENGGVEFTYTQREQEILHRTLRALPDGALIGLVLPQGFLHDKKAKALRKNLVEDFEIREISLFPDKIFAFSDIETTVITGVRRQADGAKSTPIHINRVREKSVDAFRRNYRFSSTQIVAQERFRAAPNFEMRIPDMENVWVACLQHDAFSTIADIGQGFTHVGSARNPSEQVLVRSTPVAGFQPGFAKFPTGLPIHGSPETVYVNIHKDVLRREHSGTVVGTTQVLMNYAPVGRGPWRLKAFLDETGHAVTSRFIAIRPKSRWTVEAIWALCNSPLANAYMYAHSGKRDNLVGQLRAMPVPAVSDAEIADLTDLTTRYVRVCKVLRTSEEEARDTLLKIDATILKLYDLPPRLERQILDVFEGYKRNGVPFHFDRYFPEGFKPAIPYHIYRSEDYMRSTAGEIRKHHELPESEAILSALRLAID